MRSVIAPIARQTISYIISIVDDDDDIESRPKPLWLKQARNSVDAPLLPQAWLHLDMRGDAVANAKAKATIVDKDDHA